MSRRGARLTVAVLFGLVCAAAAWQYARVERSLSSQGGRAAAFERDARALVSAVTELRSAQQGYVAAGQGADYWTARVSKDLPALRARLEGLRRQAVDAGAVTHLNAAASALERFSLIDNRAREYARGGQRLLASDVIYGEGFELTRAAVGQIDAARETEGSFEQAVTRRLRIQQQLLAAGTAGLGLLFLLILAWTPTASAESSRMASQPGLLKLTDGGTPGIASFESAERVTNGSDGLERAREQAPELAGPPPTPVVDLSAAAELCLDLARVTDPAEIPALLERITSVLDARGIVLWMADPDGRELIPTVAHGYPASSLARLGTIQRDADNATAAAFRESRVHIVKGDMLTDGAVVVPLATAGGCIGVMAAELRNEREQREEVRAVASMVAAQLATLIGVAPVPQPQARAN
jgi:CHASE3 domain sensor protein